MLDGSRGRGDMRKGPSAKGCRWPPRSWERHGNGFSLRASRRNYQRLDSTSRTVRKQICVVLSHWFCGDLLQQPQETNTPVPTHIRGPRCGSVMSGKQNLAAVW